jgi:hypothetical protein
MQERVTKSMIIRINLLMTVGFLSFLSYGQEDKFLLEGNIDSVKVVEYENKLVKREYLISDSNFIEKNIRKTINKNRRGNIIKARSEFGIKIHFADGSVETISGVGKYFRTGSTEGWFKTRRKILKRLSKWMG